MTGTTAPADQGELTLHAEMAEVEHLHPHWHLWLSDDGRVWAVTVHLPFRSSGGCTVGPGTTEQIGHEIARAEHDWPRARAA
jgi:hypothetical protein